MKILHIRGLVLAVSLATATVTQAESLTDVVNMALATNPEVLIRTSGADARMDEVRQAQAGYLPTVDVSAGVGFENSRNATTVANYPTNHDNKHQNRTRREGSITARQILFDGFATGSEVDRQRARQMAAEYEVCSTAEDTGLQVAQVYTDVIVNEKLVENARRNVREHKRVVDLVHQRGDEMGTQADMAQADSRLLLATANMIAAEAALQDTKTAYQRVIGNLPPDFVRPTVPLGLPDSLEQAMDQAHANHPVMLVTKADVYEANAQYEATKSRFMPTFTAELGATWGKDQDGGKGTTYDHTAMLRVSYNLYNGGADKARKNQASKLLNEAFEIRNRAIRQIEEEVRLAWVAVDSGSSRLAQLNAHEQNARKAVDLYKQQFDANQRTLLDLLDSQNEFYSAGNSRLRADYDLLYSKFRLLHSSGTLLSSMQASLPVDNKCGLTVAQAPQQ